MRTKASGLAVVVILLGHGVEAWASAPCGIYARIEEVRVGPDENQPQWILIKGDFIVVLDSRRQVSPVRGYICFSLEKAVVAQNGSTRGRVPLTGKNKERCLIEWDDLKSLVEEKGKGKAYVAFGSAFSELFHDFPEIQQTAEQAQASQFPYPVHHGLTKLRIPSSNERDYDSGIKGDRNPVLALHEFQAKNS